MGGRRKGSGDVPAVTVLLAAGTKASAVEAAARSLFVQSLDDFELVVLDGSADGKVTAALAGLAAEHSRVRIVVTEQAGLGAALNQGIAHSRGELIARVVPGDVSAPERLARQAGVLEAAPELAFVATGWRAAAADGSVRQTIAPPAADAALRAAMASGDAIGHPTAMLRREAVIKAGGWRPAFVGLEDYDLLLRLLDRHKGASVSEVLVEFTLPEDAPDWRTMEQLILSEMAAVAACDRRQVGRPDHGESALPIGRTDLHRMGMAADEIARVVMARAQSAALAAGAAGQWRAMREAARLGLQQEGVSGQLKSRFLGLWLRSLAHLRPVSAAAD